MPTYTFGSFQINLNNGSTGYFLLGKNFDMTAVKPVTFAIARRDGMKKSGEQVAERPIALQIKVVGTSRSDLISRLDALQQALALRGQQACIHDDGRVFNNVDCVSAPTKFSAGNGIVQATVDVAMIAYDPYAYAATASTYDTGSLTLTSGSGSWNFPMITITGGGTVYNWPLIRIYNRTSSSPTQWTNVTVAQTNDSQTLSIANSASAPLPALNGDYMDIQCDPAAVNGWSIQTNASGNFSDPAGLFPVMEPGNTTFNISIVSTNTVHAEAVFTWTSRYLS